MQLQHNLDSIDSYLAEALVGYDIIRANFGWHIHKGDTYCGLLQYQANEGWQGRALNQLPLEVQTHLQKFGQANSSMLKINPIA
ncbi:hypothetical protein ACE1CD_06665 [Aerosakkonema sp. BLCC-F183]|uniref:hypothetical protein n=1 Tax=Aerosakkonema sp. BLCC-F183 TaxID=3342834 RepID=UPI0035B840F7